MIELKNLSKTFTSSEGIVEALKDVSITVEDGDIFGIIGMSGAGKSTLVRTINLLERPSDGRVFVDGVDMLCLREKELRDARRNITMIFQGFNLLMQRTNLGNVCFPLELSGVKKSEAEQKAYELLDMVGLKDKAKAYPSQLSGGQQQRVAIARALATSPKVLLCDEATSALDPKTTNEILDLIRNINRKIGVTVVIITHSMSVVESICNKVAILDEGSIVEQGNVMEIFSNPKTSAAKRLVFPEGEDDAITIVVPGERLLRLVFNGEEITGQPLIASLALEKNIIANIRNAQTKNIGGKIFGSMLLGIQGGDEAFYKALKYIKDKGVITEEVRGNDR